MKTTSCDGWDELSARVADRLAVPLDDPFAMDVVCLEGLAHRRALSQAIAVRQGICTGVEFVPVVALRARLEHGLLGLDPASDPWRGEKLALAIHDVLAESMSEPAFAPVARHTQQADARPGRLVAVSQRFARVLRRYLVQRPDMLAAWSAGGDRGPSGDAIPAYLAWQPELWRRVQAALESWSNPLLRHRDLVRAIASATDQSATALPGRLSVIDRDGLPDDDRELVAALAEVGDVEAFILTSPPPLHPLSARFGAVRLAQARSWDAEPCEVSSSGEPDTVLHAIQDAIRRGLPAPIDREPDRSFQVHVSHGPDRQVEVLREVVTNLFDADRTLEPRDVVVCTPAIDQYASLIESHLVESADTLDHPVRGLRVQLSRQSLTPPNEVLQTIRDVYSLSLNRASVDDLIDLISRPVVAARFGFLDADLDVLRELIVGANIRWGVDANHRTASGFDQHAPGTWLQGVERLATGVAMGSEPIGWLGTTLPVAQVQSSQVDIIGRLAEFVSRVRLVLHQARTDATMPEWIVRLQQAVAMLTQTDVESQWQTAEALALIDGLSRPGSTTYGADEVLALLSSAARPTPGRANFGSGSLLVASLSDVATLPHRVVCVLGLDDQHFPEKTPPDGDDLLSGEPLPPFRDRTNLSRQHLLDALMAATETFIVVTKGMDERTNAILAPGSAVAELLSWHPDKGRNEWPGGDAVTFHTLKSYDPQNFSGELGLKSYHRIAFDAAQARARTAPRVEPQPAWSIKFPQTAETQTQLRDLVDFFKAPASTLLKHRFGTGLKQFDDPPMAELPVSGDGLAFWQTGDRIVARLLVGDSVADAMTAEQLRGDLAPGTLGASTLESAARHAKRLAATVQQFRGAEPQVISFHLNDGQPLSGTATLHNGRILAYSFSSASGKDLVEPWLTTVALAAAGQPHPGVVVTRTVSLDIAPPDADQARAYLAAAMTWRLEGLRQILPLPPKTAAVMAGLPVDVGTSKQSTPDTVWSNEHDADWAMFVGPTLADLRAVRHPCGTVETLSEEFWGLARGLIRPLHQKDQR